MTQKVIWVDEETNFTVPLRLLFQIRGYEVVPLRDASRALTAILVEPIEQVGLIIVDVMLLQGDRDGVFDDKRTENGLLTGLTLVEELSKSENGKALLSKTVLFSGATINLVVSKIRATEKQYGVKYIPKARDILPERLVGELIDYMRRSDTRHGCGGPPSD